MASQLKKTAACCKYIQVKFPVMSATHRFVTSVHKQRNVAAEDRKADPTAAVYITVQLISVLSVSYCFPFFACLVSPSMWNESIKHRWRHSAVVTTQQYCSDGNITVLHVNYYHTNSNPHLKQLLYQFLVGASLSIKDVYVRLLVSKLSFSPSLSYDENTHS